MDEELKCAICLDIPVEAVETKCCYHMFCQQCVVSVTICPNCRSPLFVEPSIFIRRVVGNMKIKCSNNGCDVIATRSSIKDH